MAATTGDEQRWKRLGALLEARRGELGYEHRPAFEHDRGINVRLAADLEKGYRRNYKPDTLGQVARGYAVTYRSIEAVLSGAADVLQPVDPQPPPAREWEPPFAPGRRDADQPHRDGIWARLVELARAGNPRPSGADLFGAGSDDAPVWDFLASQGLWDTREMVWLLADVRRRRAGQRSRPPAGTGVPEE